MSEPAQECDWILKAMIAIAASDGCLDTREVRLIQQLYETCEGRKLTASEIAKAADANEDNDAEEAFSGAATALNEAAKERLIRSAYLVLLADKRIVAEERKKLHDIAMALKISEIHLSAILEDLTTAPPNKR